MNLYLELSVMMFPVPSMEARESTNWSLMKQIQSFISFSRASKMRFRVDTSQNRRPNSLLLYRPEEYSFDTEPRSIGSFTSVLVDDLNLEIDEVGRILAIWGMCPHTRWMTAPLVPPKAEAGEVFFVPD